MPDDADYRFTEQQASRIWRRAAELQAARRLPLAGSGDESKEESRPTDGVGLTREEIAAIATEAGIEAEFLDRALTEAVLAARTGDDPEPLHARRRIEAPVAAVQAALQAIGAGDRYNLRLKDARVVNDGHLLVFELAGPESGVGGALRAGDFGAGRHILGVQAALLPAADAPEHTDLLLYGVPNPKLQRSRSVHDVGFGIVGGALGASAVGAAGVALLTLSGAAVLAPIAAGAVALGAAGVRLVRGLDRRARRVDSESLERLADDVVGAVRVRSFTQALPPSPGAEPGG